MAETAIGVRSSIRGPMICTPRGMPSARTAHSLVPSAQDNASDADDGWRSPRPRRSTWSCSCGFVTNYAPRTSCYSCDRPKPRRVTFGDVAYIRDKGEKGQRKGSGGGKGKGDAPQRLRREPLQARLVTVQEPKNSTILSARRN
jgi:hypothetical protein